MKRYQKMVVIFFLILLIYPHFIGLFEQKPVKTKEGEGTGNATGVRGFVEEIGVGGKVNVGVTRSTLFGEKAIRPGLEKVYLGGLFVLPIYILGMNFTLVHSVVLYSCSILLLIGVFMSIKTKEVKLKWN